jgi:hypothetical protein
MIVRHRQLDAQEGRFDPRNDEKEQPVHDVHEAELLVVHCDNPFMQIIEHIPGLIPGLSGIPCHSARGLGE